VDLYTATAASASGPALRSKAFPATRRYHHTCPRRTRRLWSAPDSWQSTLILLSAEERLPTSVAGDRGLGLRWRPWSPAASSASAQVATARPTCISSRSRHEYTLQCEKSPANEDPHFDSKSSYPGDKAAKDRLVEMPVFVPPPNGQSKAGRQQRQKRLMAATLKAQQTKEESYRSQYPASCTLIYTWQVERQRAWLEAIWRDDKFTYLRGQFQRHRSL